MRKLLLLTLATLAFVACTQNDVEELTANRADLPETLTVGFEDDDTRIQLNEAQKTVWNEGDLLSVFYFSNANQKWQYQGETGERIGSLKRVENAQATAETTYNVVVYPYSDSYFLNPRSCALHATLPAVQHYAEDSYGIGDNLMVAQSEFTQFSLKNVCGWLKVQLTGNGEKVTRLTLKGNNGEQLAGLIYVDTATAEATLVAEMGGFDDEENSVGGGLVSDDSILTSITLNCGEGVELGEKATAFYFAVPPQTFENGVTVEVKCESYEPMTLTTTEVLIIERNHIKPMASVEHDAEPVIPNNEIHYTATSKVEPYWEYIFGATLISNNFDSTTGKGIIIFDNDVTSIGEQAFYNCDSLTGVTIPDSVTTIGNDAFRSCDSLTSVTIGDSVTTIGEGAFYWCDSLTSVTIGNSVTTIGYRAFSDCDSLTSVTIGDSVTTIGGYAFYDCDSLTSITIPDSVTTIGEGAFYYCDSLTSITIPDSVTTIGVSAFSDCDSLTSVTIGDSVTTIGVYAFYDCTSLTSVTIGDSVTTIEYAAFAHCETLTDVTIPDSVTTIGESAFYDCYSLTSVTIGDSVTTIGEDAFRECSSLTSVTIGDSVTTIGDYAFYECYSLTSVYCEATTPPAGGSIMFYNNASDRKIYVPEESVRQYKIAAGWSGYADAIFGYDFESTTTMNYTTTDGQIVNANLPIKSNTYSNGVGTIEYYGTIIPDYAFQYCSNLTSITIPDSVTTIGQRAFAYCSSLTEFNGKFASEDGRCLIVDGTLNSFAPAGLTSYTIFDSVTTIGAEAFCNCDSLTDVTIPDSVTTIGYDAFAYCYSLTSVYCEATTPPAGSNWMFDNNASDRKIYVPTASVEAYKTADYWSWYDDDIIGYDFENSVVAE